MLGYPQGRQATAGVKYLSNTRVSVLPEGEEWDCPKNCVNLFSDIIHKEVTWYLTEGRSNRFTHTGGNPRDRLWRL